MRDDTDRNGYLSEVKPPNIALVKLVPHLHKICHQRMIHINFSLRDIMHPYLESSETRTTERKYRQLLELDHKKIPITFI